MKLTQLARWLGGILLASGLVAGSGSALAQDAPTSAAQPVATLYDQTNNAGSNSADSTDWGAHFHSSNSQSADDFIIPNNEIWHITTATASGSYIGAAGSGVLSVLVQVYANSNALPLSRLFSQTVPSASIGGLGTGIFTVSLSPVLTLAPGHYWLSVQASVVCIGTNCKHWVWTERTAQFQFASVAQNPLQGSFPCPTWQPRVTVCHNPAPDSSSGKDLLFKLDGTSVPVVASIRLPIVSR